MRIEDSLDHVSPNDSILCKTKNAFAIVDERINQSGKCSHKCDGNKHNDEKAEEKELAKHNGKNNTRKTKITMT